MSAARFGVFAFILSSALAVLECPAIATAPLVPDWSRNAMIPPEGRANPYGFTEPERSLRIERGKIHAQVYPVEVTASLVPYRPFKDFFENSPSDVFHGWARSLLRGLTGWNDVDEMLAWLGLHPYPKASDEGIYQIPRPSGGVLENRVGFGLIRRHGVEGFTFSCAACHSSRLFGKTVLGMTNRFPRANEFFVKGREGVQKVGPGLFTWAMSATKEEKESYKELRHAMSFVEAKKPATLGLDTSLAQVALSLSHRASDEWASLDPEAALHPRDEELSHFVSDSKPAVWWNLKYKSRFLSDGSVVAGNPIYTNLLWNEIGRGTDLHELESWLESNTDVIEDLTTAVFSTEAPRFTDFFPADRIPLERAKQGETIYQARCQHCHGVYVKAWSSRDAGLLPPEKLLETTRVLYWPVTPVIPVGTDPQRAEGMDSLVRGLNPLAISRSHGIELVKQKGYVPPPLVGIWARWPYFHNNSAPSLCAVLTRGEDRPKTYLAGEAEDPKSDFDSECNGYPSGDRVPESWRARPIQYDSSRPGQSRLGHDERIFLSGGQEFLTPSDKQDLIYFLQTL